LAFPRPLKNQGRLLLVSSIEHRLSAKSCNFNFRFLLISDREYSDKEYYVSLAATMTPIGEPRIAEANQG
jgi:hypothetical protein